MVQLPSTLQSVYTSFLPDKEIVVDTNLPLALHYVCNVGGNFTNYVEQVLGEIYLNWRLGMSCRTNSNNPLIVTASDGEIRFPGLTQNVPIIFQRLTVSTKSSTIPVNVLLNREAEVRYNTTPITYATALVVNFSYFHGSPTQIGSTTYFNRAELTSKDWLITIDGVVDFQARLDYLIDNKGFAITHLVKVEKIGSQPFTEMELSELLISLAYFLSFCRGKTVGVLLPTGYDAAGNVVYKEISSPRVDSWENIESWFPETAASLEELFPKFRMNWEDSDLRDALKLAIEWYTQSNQRTANVLETSIILQQIAFELLQNTLLVDYRKIISSQSFKKIDEADRLKLLLHEFGIGFDVPTSLSTLVQMTKSLEPKDGPSVLAYMRNRLVHSSQNNRTSLGKISGPKEWEAWKLGKYYLEKLLLGMLEYTGEDRCQF